MAQMSVPDFSPSHSGFGFANSFPPAPAVTVTFPGFGDVPVGNVANGLCGGMAFAARDFYEAHISPPQLAAPPAPGDPLFDYLVDRLVDSLALPRGPVRYFQWMALPDEDTLLGRGVASMSDLEEWPRIRRELSRGHPVPIGIIRTRSHDLNDLGRNHQVLCFSYETDANDRLSNLHIYDPNHPGVDVTITRADTNPISFQQSTGEPVRGFFVSMYRAVNPRFLVDPTASPPLVTITGVAATLRRLLRR